MTKLVSTWPLDEARTQELERRFPQLKVVICGSDEEQTKRDIRDADIAYGYISAACAREAQRLKIIQVPWHGVEVFSDPVFREKGIQIVNCKPLCGQTMTEHAFMFVFALYRSLPKLLEAQRDRLWYSEPLTFQTLENKTLGLLGTGAIAQRTAEIGACFGSRVIGYNRNGGKMPPYEVVFSGGQFHQFLSESDIVVSTLPHTPHTLKIMDAAAFAAMKPTALFINMGRGTTVDEPALIHALETGQIAGAGLDVTTKEPLPPDDPLWTAPNTIITPHRSGLTARHHEIGFEVLCGNLERYFRGEPLLYAVDLERGY